MNKFKVYVDNNLEEEFDDLSEAESYVQECKEGATAGKDIYGLMGDVDDSEIYDPDEFNYRIDEVDEDGNVVDSNEY